MKKVKIIILVLIVVLLIIGTISFLNFNNKKEKEKNLTTIESGEEEKFEEYGGNAETYKEPEDVISAIMDGYLGPSDTVEYERTEGDCWYYVDSNVHHYMYCQSNPVIVYIP